MTRARRHQEGYLYVRGNFWFLRYYEPRRQQDGSVSSVQRTHKLVRRDGEYRSKKSARTLADEFLKPFNDGTYTVDSTMSLPDFVDQSYFPYVESRMRPSTYKGYKNVFDRYVRPRASGSLRSFRTADCERLLEGIANAEDLSVTTLGHIKSLLSGIFRYARRIGILCTENPVRDVRLPNARPAADTSAYSLDEVLTIAQVLPEPAATVVTLAGFTGLRKGELASLRWEDYVGQELKVSRSLSRGQVVEPKTRASRAPVPVIPQVAVALAGHRKRAGNPESGYIFPNSAGNPTCLSKLAFEVIRPILEKRNIPWRGWHGFRRGLASNLHRLGVSDKIIQAILRHSNVAVTQRCYIKTAGEDATSAMSLLEAAVRKHAPNMHHSPVSITQVM